MAKKLILLMLLIPLIVMISLFTATKTISIMVDVPVSGITVSGANTHIYLNLDKNETHTLNYTISPSNAKDHTVTVTAAKYNNNTLAEFDFEQSEGSVKIIPKTMGSAIIHVTTKDGGYRGSVIVHVESQKAYELKSISSSVEKNELNIGDKVQINTEFNPTNASNTILHYSSDNESVAIVNDKGVIAAIRPGTASILIRSDFDSNIYNILTVTVLNNTVNNENNTYSPPGDFSELATEGELPLHVPDGIETIDLKNVTARAYYVNSDGLEVSLDDVIELTLVKKEVAGVEYYSISYKFKDESFVGEYNIEASYNDGENDFKLSYEDLNKTKEELIVLDLSFDGGNESVMFVSASVALPFTVSPETADCAFTYAISNSDTVANVRVVGSKLYLEANALGATTITLTASLKSDPTKFAEATVTVYVIPSSLVVANELVDGALSTLGEIFTLGKYEYANKFDKLTIESLSAVSNDTTVITDNELSLDLLFGGKGTLGAWFEEGIRWEVDPAYSEYVGVSTSKITNADGTVAYKHEIYFKDNTDTFDEIVEFKAIYEKGSKSVSASCKIRCVANGINVYSYIDLYRATKLDVDNGISRSIILRSDIIDDFGLYYSSADGQLKPHYTEIYTTYDDNYYKNIGAEADAKVKVLIEFRENVYGNGHTINAHNLTLGLLDDTGLPSTEDTPAEGRLSPTLFRGPLNFVAMSETNSNYAVSVKGQDNICFALYEGVKLNNVNLKGAMPNETDGLDLTDLDYAGTVVEILGDKTSIEFSRIQYGRMIIRAFGDINDPNKIINVDIKNTRLSEAREFIMRVGSNRFVEGNTTTPSPLLPGATDTTHSTKSRYNSLSFEEQQSYDNQFINTFITLENSVFTNAGLLAIGVDSHFSSAVLANGSEIVKSNELLKGIFSKSNGNDTFLDSWKNLSKTSYGVKIKFVGDVNLYTWKKLSDVNSDTIVEIPTQTALDRISSLASTIPDVAKFVNLVKGLKFNVQDMVTLYNKKLISEGRTPLVTGDGDVHGGIIFFGGGKNYGVFDYTEANLTTQKLSEYQVDLADVGSGYLKTAAGDEKFCFFMFNSNDYSDTANGDDSVIIPK